MPSLKKLRRWKKAPYRTFQSHTTATESILASSSSQLPSPSSSRASTIYRNTSDAAQTYLPPIQAAANMIPGVGSILKGAIGGILSTLQLVDRHIQNKVDLKTLRRRLYQLRHHIDNVPTARTPIEETLRQELLSALETAKSELERMQKRIRGAPSLTQDIAGCITTVNNHLFEYMVTTAQSPTEYVYF
ncbi:hypothetical protein OG21DRAFT_1482158 [Imleria badia]|nr:hypothetical protein OG21DRAFT_1482158 [Imleria badia]